MVSDEDRKIDKQLDEIYARNDDFINPSDRIKLKEVTRNPELTKWLMFAIWNYSVIAKKRLGSSYKLNVPDILERLKPSIEFMKNSNNLKPIILKDYVIKIQYGVPRHVENIIEFKIYSQDNKVIGTIGFLISKNKKGPPQLIMNHISRIKPKFKYIRNY